MKFYLTVSVCIILFLTACSEYAYRHEIEGVLIDSVNNPVAGARLRRQTENGKPYGAEHVYEIYSSSDGKFSFIFSGLGRKPKPVDTWRVAIEHPDFHNTSFTINVSWTERPDTSGSYGYIKKNIIVQLERLTAN